MMTKAEELARAQGRIEGLMEAVHAINAFPLPDDPPGFAKNRYQYAIKAISMVASAIRAQADKLKRELAGGKGK